MTKDTGGPAFPHTVEYKGADCGGVVPHGGMSLRDYFAAHVAVGAMSEYWNGDRMRDPTFDDIAQHAYALADAMLEARQA